MHTPIESEESSRGGDGVGTSHEETQPHTMQREPLADEVRRFAMQAREWVSEHPLAAIGVAVALGFTAGRVVRR